MPFTCLLNCDVTLNPFVNLKKKITVPSYISWCAGKKLKWNWSLVWYANSSSKIAQFTGTKLKLNWLLMTSSLFISIRQPLRSLNSIVNSDSCIGQSLFRVAPSAYVLQFLIRLQKYGYGNGLRMTEPISTCPRKNTTASKFVPYLIY